MSNLKDRLKRCTPYLRVATLVSRETIYDLMMQTDLETVYTMLAVVNIGFTEYEKKLPCHTVPAEHLLGDTLAVMPVYSPPSMDKEMQHMLDLQGFRKYIIAGMHALGIY